MKLRATFAATALLGLTAAFTAGHAENSHDVSISQLALDEDAETPRFTASPEGEETPVDVPLANAIDAAGAAVRDSATTISRKLEGGVASWYGPGLAGSRTASGERFDPDELTAAHRTLPFGSLVKVTYEGKSVVVRINDRGPFAGDRVIDLSEAAAEMIGIVGPGHGRVSLALLAK